MQHATRQLNHVHCGDDDDDDDAKIIERVDG